MTAAVGLAYWIFLDECKVEAINPFPCWSLGAMTHTLSKLTRILYKVTVSLSFSTCVVVEPRLCIIYYRPYDKRSVAACRVFLQIVIGTKDACGRSPNPLSSPACYRLVPHTACTYSSANGKLDL